jgi:hypothetical protein
MPKEKRISLHGSVSRGALAVALTLTCSRPVGLDATTSPEVMLNKLVRNLNQLNEQKYTTTKKCSNHVNNN